MHGAEPIGIGVGIKVGIEQQRARLVKL